MSLLKKLTPINLLEEKEKFFADTSYNPQFIYEEDIDESELYKYGLPKKDILEKATEIIEKTQKDYTDEQIQNADGPELSQNTIIERINQFLHMHDIDNRYNIQLSNSYIARASINLNTIKLRLPINFRERDLTGMIYHELGTHALRQINYENQPWYKNKKKYGFQEYLITEEGLAVLHSLIPKTLKLAYRPARYYIASHFAQQYSFSEMFEKLDKLISDKEKRWTTVLRQKRGINDTSQPGGFTKDIVYFKGLVEMFDWLQSNNFTLDHLYYGKLAKEDTQKALQLNPNYNPILPSFYITDKSKYIEEISKIGRSNFL